MIRLHPVRHADGGRGWAFWCPGCQELHELDPRWQVTDPEGDTPSASPSLVVHATDGRARCHSSIHAGAIQYHNDCQHKLAGCTVPLPPVEEWI